MRWRDLFVCFAPMIACGCESEARVDVAITAGQETLFDEVRTVTVTAKSVDGSIAYSTTTPVDEPFDLGAFPTDQWIEFGVTGMDASGKVVARGRSVSVAIGALESDTLPLFIGRLHETARAPGGLVRSHVHAPSAILAERYLMTVGGSKALGQDGSADTALGDFYDVLTWSGAESGRAFPRSPTSMAVVGSSVLLVDDAGASWIDLDAQTTSEVGPIEGFSFSEISGGRTILGEGDIQYIIGPTRDGAPTTAVLSISPDGTLEPLRFSTPRSQAATTVVADVGLIVVGGSSDGPGVELIDPLGQTTRALPFAPISIAGAAAFVVGPDLVGLAGGTLDSEPAEALVVDVRCVSQADCVPSPLTGLAVPTLRAAGQGFAVDGRAIAVGESDAGETQLFLIDPSIPTARQVPLKERRFGASVLPAPNGTLAILGGASPSGERVTSVEFIFPDLDSDALQGGN